MDLTSLKGRRRSFLIALGVLALVTLLLRALALITAFDAEIGYFKSDAALPVLTRVLEILALAACFVPLFLFNKNELPVTHRPLNLAARIAAGLAAVCLLAAAVFLLPRLSTIPAPRVLVLLAAVLLAAGSLYFVFLLRVKEAAATPFGYAVILGAVLLLSITYFDRYTQMNTPHKVSLHLSLLCVMVWMLFELRAVLGIAKPRGLAVTSSLCLFYPGVCGGSNVIAFLAGSYRDPLYLMGDLVCLGIAVYVACRAASDLRYDMAISSEAEVTE